MLTHVTSIYQEMEVLKQILSAIYFDHTSVRDFQLYCAKTAASRMAYVLAKRVHVMKAGREMTAHNFTAKKLTNAPEGVNALDQINASANQAGTAELVQKAIVQGLAAVCSAARELDVDGVIQLSLACQVGLFLPGRFMLF